jgi:hypothetical protein
VLAALRAETDSLRTHLSEAKATHAAAVVELKLDLAASSAEVERLRKELYVHSHRCVALPRALAPCVCVCVLPLGGVCKGVGTGVRDVRCRGVVLTNTPLCRNLGWCAIWGAEEACA